MTADERELLLTTSAIVGLWLKGKVGQLDDLVAPGDPSLVAMHDLMRRHERAITRCEQARADAPPRPETPGAVLS